MLPGSQAKAVETLCQVEATGSESLLDFQGLKISLFSSSQITLLVKRRANVDESVRQHQAFRREFSAFSRCLLAVLHGIGPIAALLKGSAPGSKQLPFYRRCGSCALFNCFFICGISFLPLPSVGQGLCGVKEKPGTKPRRLGVLRLAGSRPPKLRGVRKLARSGQLLPFKIDDKKYL